MIKKFRKMVGEHQNDWTDLNLTQHLSHASLQPAVFNCSLKKYHYDHCHYALCKNKYQLSLLKWPRFCVEDHCWWWELRWEQFSAIFTLRVHRKSFLTFTGLYGVTWTLSTFQNKKWIKLLFFSLFWHTERDPTCVPKVQMLRDRMRLQGNVILYTIIHYIH